jgi:hypothetical protein
LTRAEQIVAKEAEQKQAGLKLKESLELQKAVAKDIVAFRATSMRLRQEVLALQAEEAKAQRLRQDYAVDAKKPLADAMTTRLPTHLPASAFMDVGKPAKGKK